MLPQSDLAGKFSASFPEDSDKWREKIQGLLASFQRSRRAPGRFCTEQERAMIVSLYVACTLNRQKRPFNESETVEDCMLTVSD